MSLILENLTKRYGAQAVVDAVSLNVPKTGLTGVIGPNGAGKSTLFSLITGFIPANGGTVDFDGMPLSALAPDQRAQAGLVRTFQVPREYANLSVRDNLMAAAPEQAGENLTNVFFRPALVRAQEQTLASKVEKTLAILNLTRVADVRAGSLSGGQKKLVELGRALMTGACMILLDEPFAGVNPVLIAEISELIRTLNTRGVGFLIIEHDLKALSRLVETLHVMDRGRIIASGAPADVLSRDVVREAYLGGAAA